MLNKALGAGNDLHFTDAEVPDPNPLPQVGLWRILVRPIPAKTKTKGGILLPDQTMDVKDILGTVGRILAIGPTAFRRPDMLVDGQPNRWLRVGDHIIYARHAGAKLTYAGVKLIIMNDDEPLAIIHNPQDFLE